jgi:hypothetical protein
MNLTVNSSAAPRRWGRRLAWASLALTLLLVLLCVGLAWWAGSWLDATVGPWSSGVIHIDGEQFEWQGLEGGSFSAVALLAGLAVSLVVLVVLPLVLVLGIGLPLLVGGLVLAAGLAVAGLALAAVLSPLLLLVLLLWWALRGSGAKAGAGAPTAGPR